MARACKDHGARDIYACVSHGILTKGSAARIAESPIKELVLTDTIGYRAEPLPPLPSEVPGPAITLTVPVNFAIR